MDLLTCLLVWLCRQHYDHLPQVMLEGVGGVAEKNDSAGDLLDSENVSRGGGEGGSWARLEEGGVVWEGLKWEVLEGGDTWSLLVCTLYCWLFPLFRLLLYCSNGHVVIVAF